MTMIVGLTGSIAMGKTTVANMFRNLGVPVFDSDEQVHKLYEKGAQGTELISRSFPTVILNGSVDRKKLSKLALEDKSVLAQIESLIHPLVHEKQNQFIKEHTSKNIPIVILDIPLLYEKRREKEVDQVVVVSAPFELQQERALARPGMTRDKFAAILAKQLVDHEKRARADFIIDTGQSLEKTFEQVSDLVKLWQSKD